MNPINLWFARLFPPIGFIVHAAAVMMALHGPEQTGYLLILAVWGLTVLYCFGVYAGGDFIHRTLGVTPWPKGDDFQAERRRAAMAFVYWVTLFALGLVIGLNAEAVTADRMGEYNSRVMFLELLLAAYAGGVAPTAYLGWRLKPLAQEG